MKLVLIVLGLVLAGMLSGNLNAKNRSDAPEYTVEGLKLIPSTKNIALVWADPEADLAQYKRIYLVEADVAFKKNWRPEQNRGAIMGTCNGNQVQPPAWQAFA